MGLVETVSQIERELQGIKTSQAIGSSSARVMKVADINLSGTTQEGEEEIFIVFKGETAFPLVMPRLTVKVNGVVAPVLSDLSQTLNTYTYMAQDDFWVAESLCLRRNVSFSTFDENTTGLFISIHVANWASASFSVVGELYATMNGTMETYMFDGGYVPPVP